MLKIRLFYMARTFILSGLFCIIATTIQSQDLNPASWSHLKGYWKFQKASQLTKATVGNDLTLIGTHSIVNGPSWNDTAIRIGIGSYYKCRHGISPNGGGDSVNRYTLMFDFKVLNFDRWHTFFQTDSTNTNDGECFIRPNTGTDPGCIGTATTSYTLNPVTANKWYRLVISVNLDNFYRYYLNGSLVLDGDTQYVDKRFALTQIINFFADNNGEDDTIDIASVAIFDTCLSSVDIAKIGTIDPCVINPPHVNLGVDTGLCADNSMIKNAGGSYKSYLWSTGDTTSSVRFDIKKLKLGSNSVWAKVTDINGCTARDTIKITMNSNPPKPLITVNGKTNFCNGDSLKLQGPVGYSGYFWSNGAKLSYCYINKTKNVKLQVKDANNCYSPYSDSVIIKVFPLPPKPVIQLTRDSIFCMGDSAILGAPPGYPSYVWSNSKYTRLQTIKTSGQYSVHLTDTNGCMSPESQKKTITVYSLPAKPAITLFGKNTFCDGDSVLLRVSGTLSVFWQDGLVSPNRTVKKTGWFKVFVTDSNKCKSPVSDSIKIMVNANPLKPIINISGKDTFCDGDSTILNVSSTKVMVYWQDGLVSSTRTVKSDGWFKVYVKDGNQCVSPFSDSVKVTVNSNPPKPVISYTGSTEFCGGNYLVLSAPSGYKYYLWNNKSFSKDIVVDSTGKYQVIVVNANGCISPWSDTVGILVHPQPPKPFISPLGKDSLKCGIAADKYEWYRNGVLLSDTVRTIFGSSTGFYQVRIIKGGCPSVISDSTLHTGIAVSSFILKGLEVFPNPATTEIFIKIENIVGQSQVSIMITDLQGRIVKETKSTSTSLKTGINLNINELKQGVYLLRVISANGLWTTRIQKLAPI